jgi:hypothetical protein
MRRASADKAAASAGGPIDEKSLGQSIASCSLVAAPSFCMTLKAAGHRNDSSGLRLVADLLGQIAKERAKKFRLSNSSRKSCPIPFSWLLCALLPPGAQLEHQTVVVAACLLVLLKVTHR